MYSVVLMMAMTTSVETPSCGRAYSCHTHYYGGCNGYYYTGCHSGYYYGGCQGYYNRGCCGCYGYYGSVIVPGPVITNAPVIQNVITGAGGRQHLLAPAQIRVTLPENARLLVDSQTTTSTGVVRNLATPPLEGGSEFNYTLTASIMRDQKEIKLEKRVTVRAGETTEVSLEFPPEVALK
jgi:uncharacterized protein (TIGR03000 family)